MTALAKRVGMAGVVAGLAGGVVMIALTIVVMGAKGSGYATPLNSRLRQDGHPAEVASSRHARRDGCPTAS